MQAATMTERATDSARRPGERYRSLVEPHLDALYGYCVNLCGSRPDAEDLLQDALVRGLRGQDGLRDPAKARSWLFTIVTNAWRDRHRSRGRELDTISMDASAEEDDFSLYETVAVEDPFPYSDELHLDFLRLFRNGDVRRVFAAIAPVHRLPLILTAVHGFSCKEAAAILDVPLGTVLSRLHRGRRQLERGMWDYAVRNRLVEVGDDAD